MEQKNRSKFESAQYSNLVQNCLEVRMCFLGNESLESAAAAVLLRGHNALFCDFKLICELGKAKLMEIILIPLHTEQMRGNRQRQHIMCNSP